MAVFTTHCAFCGALYEASRSDSRFCSDAHRAAATRARLDAEATARVERLRALTARHFDALRRGLEAADLASVADELDAIDAEAALDGWPVFPRLTP